jgi:hypothetical protein
MSLLADSWRWCGWFGSIIIEFIDLMIFPPGQFFFGNDITMYSIKLERDHKKEKKLSKWPPPKKKRRGENRSGTRPLSILYYTVDEHLLTFVCLLGIIRRLRFKRYRLRGDNISRAARLYISREYINPDSVFSFIFFCFIFSIALKSLLKCADCITFSFGNQIGNLFVRVKVLFIKISLVVLSVFAGLSALSYAQQSRHVKSFHLYTLISNMLYMQQQTLRYIDAH